MRLLGLIVCPAFVTAGTLLGVACSVGGSEPPKRPAATEVKDGRNDGTVHLSEGAAKFIAVEVIDGSADETTISAPARVEFRDGSLSQIGVPLAGRVVKVHVQVGDHVRQGDSLVTLDCPEAASIRASMESTTASLREARAAYERQTRMIDQGVGTDRDRLAAETRVSEVEAELSRLRANAAFVGSGVGTTVVLPSPLAGTVVSRKATVGMTVQGSDPVIEVGDPSAVWIVADVFERDLPHIKEASRATVTFESLDAPVQGRVTSVGAVVATGLRSAPVRIAIESHGQTLRPGMFGRATVSAVVAGLSLPTEAILIKDGKESVVFVEQAPLTFIRRRVVAAAHAEDGRVQIVSGIRPGERVVVKGALLLDGAADQLL